MSRSARRCRLNESEWWIERFAQPLFRARHDMTGHTLPLPLLLSVSDVTRLIRDSLEEQFRDIWIEGEITNLRAPSSGHLYFTLKDEQSQLRGVLFRSERLGFDSRCRRGWRSSRAGAFRCMSRVASTN